MLCCVHGQSFTLNKLRSDERRVEKVCCLHCNEMHQGEVWLSSCCFNKFRQVFEDVSILNNGAHCMLCKKCMSTLKPRGQLTEGDYQGDFKFYYEK